MFCFLSVCFLLLPCFFKSTATLTNIDYGYRKMHKRNSDCEDTLHALAPLNKSATCLSLQLEEFARWICSDKDSAMSVPTVGDVQRQMPKPDEMKRLVKYKGPSGEKAVLKQAATNSELQKAVELGDAEMIKAILRFGLMKRCVNVNAPLWPKRERLLHLAAQKGFRDVCILLLEAKAEIDAEEICDGKHPVHEACKHGHYDVCELLLDRRAHIEEATFTGMRPLHWAASEGHAEICDMLLDRKAVPYAASGDLREVLHHAAAKGHAAVVELLCRRGAKLDSDGPGQSPLHLACLGGHLQAAKALLDHGALSSLQDFGPNGALRRCQDTDIEDLVRCIGQLNLKVDEAEEMDDMGQHDEAQALYAEVLADFDRLGMVHSAQSLRASLKLRANVETGESDA